MEGAQFDWIIPIYWLPWPRWHYAVETMGGEEEVIFNIESINFVCYILLYTSYLVINL